METLSRTKKHFTLNCDLRNSLIKIHETFQDLLYDGKLHTPINYKH